VATNIDGLLVLIALFADPDIAARDVVVGESLGMALIVLASYCAAIGLVAVAGAWIRYLGLVPIAIGVVRLLLLLRFQKADAEPASRPRTGNILIVTAIVLGNGGDNLATYISLFANLSNLRIIVCVILFGALTALWCALGHFLVGRRAARKQVRRWGRRVLPFLMIGLGLRILMS
jgi:cadmium resistance protein CadD (predicted permease)